MSVVGAAIPRAIGLIALLVLAVVTLRGYIPGTGGPRAVSPPSAVTVALMPVLSLVSVVILLAGVITSQHRLPLSLPDQDRDAGPQPGRLRRLGLALLVLLAVIALFAAAAWALYLVTGGSRTEVRQPPAGATPTAPVETPPPTPKPFSGTPELGDGAMTLVAVSAAALVATALIGLVVVAVGTHARPAAQPVVPDHVPADPGVSLAQVAEMGLAAMIASGQDARTAIIACYGAMERGLAQAREVAPLISDTSSEVLARAFERGALHDASARELVALFEEARFSPHAMLEWQRMRAEQLLRIVLNDLQGARL
nr:DUF4129 domain-containing protein [Nocardia sp. BMG51109]